MRMVNEAILIQSAIASVISEEGGENWQSLIERYLNG